MKKRNSFHYLFVNLLCCFLATQCSSSSGNDSDLQLQEINADDASGPGSNVDKDPVQYTITFLGNGATGGSMPVQAMVSGTAQTLRPNQFTHSTHDFAGWSMTADGGVDMIDQSVYIIENSDLTLYAVWAERPTYAITFDGNGATSGSMAAQSIIEGVSAQLFANQFVRTNYYFSGWSLESDQSVSYTDQATYVMGDSDITVYAVWTAKPAHLVSFNGNGASAGSMNAISIIEDGSGLLPANEYVLPGHSFQGWATTAAATTAEFLDQASFVMGDSAVTLYAVWNQNDAYTIQFDGNGAESGSMAPQSIIQGLSANLVANQYTKPGYYFSGWSIQPNQPAVHADEASYLMGNANITLYATWSENPVYSVTFLANGGSGNMNNQSDLEGKTITLLANEYTLARHDFLGWSTQPVGQVEYTNQDLLVIPGQDLTLYAQWQLNPDSPIEGILDASFGENGQFLLSLGKNSRGTGAAQAADGSIFITGCSGTTYCTNRRYEPTGLLVKLSANGFLDTSFQGTGYKVLDGIAQGNGHDSVLTIKASPTGGIIYGGYSANDYGRSQIFLSKIDATGTPDPLFGQGGTFLLPGTNGRNTVDIDFDPITKQIYLVSTQRGATLWKVHSDGSSLDSTFQNSGLLNLGERGYRRPGVAVNKAGKVIVHAFERSEEQDRDALSWVITSSGEFDQNYGNPLVHSNLAGGSGHDTWTASLAVGEEYVYLLGWGHSGDERHNAVVAKVSISDGSVDPNFGGGDGIWSEDISGTGRNDRIQAAVLQPDGSIIAAVAVKRAYRNLDIAIIRLLPNGTRDSSFADNGALWLGGDFRDSQPRLSRLHDGRILVVSSLGREALQPPLDSERRNYIHGDLVAWVIK